MPRDLEIGKKSFALIPKNTLLHNCRAWTNDDLIEYLLSAHRDRCASVMSRLKASGDPGFLKGIPELCAIVLDEMARDESIGDVRTALRLALSELLGTQPALRDLVEEFCLIGIGENSNRVLDLPLSALRGQGSTRQTLAEDLLRLVRHRPVGLLLAADRITFDLKRDSALYKNRTGQICPRRKHNYPAMFGSGVYRFLDSDRVKRYAISLGPRLRNTKCLRLRF